MKYYLVKLLTNTQGQDGSSIEVFADSEEKTAKEKAYIAYHNTCAAFHDAKDVLYAVVEVLTESAGVEIVEIINHRPEPEPTPEPEEKTT